MTGMLFGLVLVSFVLVVSAFGRIHRSYLLLAVPAAALGFWLLVGDSASADHMTLTITTSAGDAGADPVTLGAMTYAQTADALAAAEAAGSASLLFESGITGLPTMEAAQGSFSGDDAARRIVVRGQNVTMFSQPASVLVTAVWTSASDTDPQLAVLVRFDDIGLGALNTAFDQFPVTVNSAIVGLGNADQTLDPLALGAEDFFTDGVDSGGAQGTLADFDVDDSAVTFAGAITGGVLADGAEVLGGGAVRLRGSLGVSGVLEEGGPTAGLDLTATVATSTPDTLAGQGVSLDGEWTLSINASLGTEYSATISGQMDVDLGDGPINVAGSIGVVYAPGPPASTTFKLAASVGSVDNLAGLDWLDLTSLEVAADITKTAGGVDATVSITAALTVGTAPDTVSGTVTISASRSGGETTTAFSLEVSNNISASSILAALGAPTDDLDDGWDVTLTDFRLDFTSTSTGSAATKSSTIAVSGGAELFAGPGCAPGDPDFDGAQADVLFRKRSVGATSTFLASGQLGGLTLKQLSCDVPFDWTLPTIAVTVANAPISQPWDSVDAPTKAYFTEILCPAPTDTCPSFLEVDQGLSVRASITLDGDVEDALGQIGITVDGPLVVTGTLPLLGGTVFALEVALPAVQGADDDFVKSGIVSMSIAAEGGDISVGVGGDITFRVQRPDQSTCANPSSDGTIDGNCYDELTLVVSASIAATTSPPGIEFALSGTVDNWQDAFGLSALDINRLALDVTIEASATEGVNVELGMGGQLVIGSTDLTIAIHLQGGLTPPRIVLDGLTIGSSKGLALRDVVSTFAPGVDTASIPDLSLKNLWFAYGAEAKPELCIMQGFYISAEVHINDSDSDITGNPVCGSTVPASDAVPRTCSGSASCIAGLQLELTPSGFTADGSISAFDLGPISFAGLDVSIHMTATEQFVKLSGGATLYDPILFYASPEDNRTRNVWASGFLGIDVGQASGQFHLVLDGCAVIGGTQAADSTCSESDDAVFQASVDGSIFADFTKVGMAFFEDASVDFDLRLTAPALAKLVEQLGAELEPVADWFESAGAAVTGTTEEIVQEVETGFCVAFSVDCDSLEVAADAYDDAPDYIDAEIDATDVAIRDSAAVGLHCFFTDWPIKDCIDGFRKTARDANDAAIAAEGGDNYIALHGIDRTGFGGIVDSDFPDVYWVDPTTFQWPDGGPANAPCGTNGDLLGNPICDASASEIADPDSLVAPVLLEALGEIDPVLAALFESGDLQVGDVAGGASGFAARTLSPLAATAEEFDAGKFVDSIRHLAGAFDTGSPLAVCQATTSFQWFGSDGPPPPALDLTTKVDAYGGKANIQLDPFGGQNGTAGLDLDTIKHDVLDDVLRSAVTDLQCPTNAGDPSPGGLSFTMSTASIPEGATLTLTGTAPANATIAVDWGDGTTTTPATAGADGTWTADHTYVEGPAFRIIHAISGDLDANSAVAVTNVPPTIEGLSIPASTTEAAAVSINGTVTDPGVLDGHVVTVTWGDGTRSEQVLAAGADGSFSLSHTYVDDDPTSTAEDTYAVTVEVTDDDRGKGTTAGAISVANVAPTDLVLTAATWGDGESATVDEDGHLVVPEGVDVTVSGSFRDPGTQDTHALQVDWGDGGFASSTTTQRDAADPTLVYFTFTHTFADDHPATGTPSDLVALRLAVADDDSGALAVDQPVRIADVAPVVAVDPVTQDVQYSDSIAGITLQATDVGGVLAQDGSGSEPLVASTRWQLDGGVWNQGLPADLALGEADCELVDGTSGAGTRQSCTWQITGRADVAPGTYSVELTITDDDTLATVATTDVVVLPEDARVDSLAPTVASAPSVLNGFIDLELRATVRDISVVPGIDPADGEPGDITHATVTFVDRGTGQALCTAPVVTMFAGDTTTGGAACTARIATTGSAASWDVDLGFVVGGWYTRDDPADDAPLTVRRPFAERVHGYHAVVASSGAGTLAPTGGTPINGAVAQVRYAPNRRSINGTIVVTFRSNGRTYQAGVTRIDSLGVLPQVAQDVNLIEIEALADVTDITSGSPVPVAAGLRLQLRYQDHHAPSTPDVMEVAAWTPSGVLLAGAHWDVVEPTGMVLTDGQILVS